MRNVDGALDMEKAALSNMSTIMSSHCLDPNTLLKFFMDREVPLAKPALMVVQLA